MLDQLVFIKLHHHARTLLAHPRKQESRCSFAAGDSFLTDTPTNRGRPRRKRHGIVSPLTSHSPRAGPWMRILPRQGGQRPGSEIPGDGGMRKRSCHAWRSTATVPLLPSPLTRVAAVQQHGGGPRGTTERKVPARSDRCGQYRCSGRSTGQDRCLALVPAYLTHEYLIREQTCDPQELRVVPLTIPLFLKGRLGRHPAATRDNTSESRPPAGCISAGHDPGLPEVMRRYL
jgi:hypothetical protein